MRSEEDADMNEKLKEEENILQNRLKKNLHTTGSECKSKEQQEVINSLKNDRENVQVRSLLLRVCLYLL